MSEKPSHVHVDGGRIETYLPPQIVQELKPQPRKDDPKEKLKFWIQFLTLFFVIIYTLFSGSQTYLFHESMKNDQRAYVGAWHPEKTNDWVIHNYGKTPASNVTDQVIFHLDKGKIDDIRKWLKTNPIEGDVLHIGVLFPSEGTVMGGAKTESGQPETLDQVLLRPEVRHGDMTVYMIGYTRYSDIFGDDHLTEFCFMWVPEVGGFDPGYGCKTYNTAN